MRSSMRSEFCVNGANRLSRCFMHEPLASEGTRRGSLGLYRSGSCEQDGGYGQAADQERKPDWRKPGYRNQEQHIGVCEREGPADCAPKSCVVHNVPDGKNPKEKRRSNSQRCRGKKHHTE